VRYLLEVVLVTASTACLWLAAIPAAQPASRRSEPFVPVAVSYPGPLARDRERAIDDLEAIRTLGFNSIRLAIEWADGEPARGKYRFDTLDEMLTLAGQSGLKVMLQLSTASVPAWVLERYPDGRFVSETKAVSRRTDRICLDHSGLRADVASFVAAATARAARHATSTSSFAWHSIDLGSELQDGLCLCPHTQRRFRDWLKATTGSAEPAAASASADAATFVALERRDHLAALTDAAAARGIRVSTSAADAPSVLRQLTSRRRDRPGQDDWLMTTVVDHYGTLLPPQLVDGRGLAPPQLALALDGLRSAVRDKGWLATTSASAADERLLTWLAVSRGARGVTFGDWRASGARAGPSLVGADGTISNRARAAGGLARVIGRNPALFAPLKPRAARVAIVYDPRSPIDGSSPAAVSLSTFYRALFERNVQVDFIHLEEIAAGVVSRYVVVFVGSPSTLPTPAADALKAYVAAGGAVISGSAPVATDRQIAEIVARAGVRPDVRIEGASGPVETRFLESSDVLLLIGLNYADVQQRVTLTFTPDTQEAIWQNMETGAAINFVAGPEGPTYTYTFGPRDALVLMIRKSVR
jgi:Beta-galactosidase/Beta-galactosidase trimerisation domain